MNSIRGVRGKALVWAVGVCIGVVAVGVIGKKVFDHLTETTASVAQKFDAPIPVQLSVVAKGQMEEIIGAEGMATESASVPVRSIITSQVVDLPVDVGDVVRKDQLLIGLNSSLQRSALGNAKKQVESSQVLLALARKKSERIQDLFKHDLATADELEKAQREETEAADVVAAARDKLVEAKYNFDAATIVAPASAVVTSRDIVTGATTKPLSDLLTLNIIDPVHVEVGLSEDRTRFLFIGQEAEVSFYAFPGRKFKGQVVVIKPTIDEKNRLVTAVIKLTNTELEIKPGMRGIVNLKNNRVGLKIPDTAITGPREDNAKVFVVDNDQIAHLRAVRTGMMSAGYVEVREGLTEGDRIVVVGQAGLRDNNKVRIGEEYVSKAK